MIKSIFSCFNFNSLFFSIACIKSGKVSLNVLVLIVLQPDRHSIDVAYLVLKCLSCLLTSELSCQRILLEHETNGSKNFTILIYDGGLNQTNMISCFLIN